MATRRQLLKVLVALPAAATLARAASPDGGPSAATPVEMGGTDAAKGMEDALAAVRRVPLRNGEGPDLRPWPRAAKRSLKR